ncbi:MULTISPECIES: 2-dehydro-3-deoxy-D-gluconate 5-dehydrogenase KduD [Clostridium]|uniref:2-dehydro-3-deoxy-D-gluconate 5-dehydrogenase KduD n=1 Tax=Clostridium TaxID=1485 RepID=UPI0005C25C0F|nr:MULTISPECIES: 2-dehydro-3-deoxy-D-gluconate 5-dehydrogenase KduD [Clostridium]AXB85183.1 2-deoxy-D-gluconate 3-dehydrogenase [Clostridium butyricum]KIU08248.1 2-deoxy-D-gluconate 3-dehydrogenase [Clostridium butyricum]MBA8968086.1 2-deoxy-D-gluconate 3-dehydrogenase [Clostridium butyricum]MBA8970859.1 2-deoxy-D-gluconate 3-dehydrogenase [Clostridium butyricum]MBC2426320.1 2-dehydro-3-deoxy-D-gluconate 5-dehydrogenase KduD [Clostridium butyricum]
MSEELRSFSMDFFSLKGKVAIVTGGNKGLGQAYAIALAKAGADVVIPTHGKEWDETRKLIEDTGRQVTFIQGDITSREDRENIIRISMQVYGKIDILVNNAGTIKRAPLLEYKEEDWNAVMEINLNSLYFLSQDVAKIMAEQGSGKIINIASMLSFQGGKFVPPYTASKHGVAGITKAFANELACRNIQVNAIAPGYVKTANTKQIRDDKKRNKEILDRIPAERWAEPFDLMGAVVFLASRASDYINGHILTVDGGWLVR